MNAMHIPNLSPPLTSAAESITTTTCNVDLIGLEHIWHLLFAPDLSNGMAGNIVELLVAIYCGPGAALGTDRLNRTQFFIAKLCEDLVIASNPSEVHFRVLRVV